MALIIRGAEPSNVFALHGANENDATFALAWALEKSSNLLAALAEHLFGEEIDLSAAVIQAQRHGEDGGYTDLEIHDGDKLHVIIEAKAGWLLPAHEQLARYRPRLKNNPAARQLIVSLSAAEAPFVNSSLPAEVDGARVAHMSWSDVRRLCATASRRASSFEEKLWLRHLSTFMREFSAMERVNDNTVYVVSLSSDLMREGGDQTFIQVVEDEGRYFHPVGRTFPVQPPNYMGFRYGGVLRSVHHVDRFAIVSDLSAVSPSWPETDFEHFVYELGPSMRPAIEMRTGKVFRAARVYCAIDTLLSGQFTLLSDARDETNRRVEAL